MFSTKTNEEKCSGKIDHPFVAPEDNALGKEDRILK